MARQYCPSCPRSFDEPADGNRCPYCGFRLGSGTQSPPSAPTGPQPFMCEYCEHPFSSSLTDVLVECPNCHEMSEAVLVKPSGDDIERNAEQPDHEEQGNALLGAPHSKVQPKPAANTGDGIPRRRTQKGKPWPWQGALWAAGVIVLLLISMLVDSPDPQDRGIILTDHESFLSGVGGPARLLMLTLGNFLKPNSEVATGFMLEDTWGEGAFTYRIGFVCGCILLVSLLSSLPALVFVVERIRSGLE